LLEKRLPAKMYAINRFPLVTLEKTARNKVPSEDIHAGTLFLTVIFRLTKRLP
jgi:hypothetical protein